MKKYAAMMAPIIAEAIEATPAVAICKNENTTPIAMKIM